MPPKYRLAKEDVSKFAKWISDGAAWPEEAVANVNTGEKFDLVQRMRDHWVWEKPVDHRTRSMINRFFPNPVISHALH